MPCRSTLKGPAAKALAALGIETHADLVEHLPHSHRDRRDTRKIAELGVGEDATVLAVVRAFASSRCATGAASASRRASSTSTGPMVAVWFNQPWIARELGEGAQVLLHGKLRRRNEFWVSEYELAAGEAPVHTVGLVPVHPASEGIAPARLRKLVWDDYQLLLRHTVEPLPARLRVEERLADRPAALAGAHFPDDEDEEAEARRRLAFEELLLLQLALAGRRRARREGQPRRAA